MVRRQLLCLYRLTTGPTQARIATLISAQGMVRNLKLHKAQRGVLALGLTSAPLRQGWPSPATDPLSILRRRFPRDAR